MLFVIAVLASIIMWWLSAAGVYDYPQFFAAAPLMIWWVLGTRSGKKLFK